MHKAIRYTGHGVGILTVTVIAVTLAILATGPGHNILRGRLLAALNKSVEGTVTIGSIDGALWRGAKISNIEMRTADGKSVIQAEQVAVTYAITDFLRGRFILRSVTLIHPVIELVQEPGGRWNYQRLLRITGDTTTRTTKRPLVLLKDVTITRGTLIIRARGAQDTVVTRRIDGLSTDLVSLRVSHPDSTAIEVVARRLVARIDNPRLDLRNADGTLALDADSLKFDLDHVTLPGTQASFRGRMRWGGANLELHAAVNAKPLTFADLRSIIPMLPKEGGGEMAVLADMQADGTTRADIRRADVHSGRSALSGRGDFTFRPGGNGTAHNVDLLLQPLDFALVASYVDSLPVRGLLRGRLHADGALKDLRFDAALDWTDEGVPGSPHNVIDGRGRLVMGGQSGVDFREVTLRRGDFDLASIRRLAPSVKLAGRLQARGTLEGPWRAAQFHGVIDHYALDSAGQASTIHGDVKLGIGAITRVDAEVDVDSLSMNLLHRSYPAIPLTGMLRGRIVAHGPLDSLVVHSALAGSAGQLTAEGVIQVRDSAVIVALAGTFDSLNLHGMRAVQPPSQLVGTWRADVSVPSDSTRVTTGSLGLGLTGVTLGEVALGPGTVAIRLEPDRIAIDTATLAFNGGALEATGAIGRGPGASGTINFAAHADTIGYLEPLVRFFATAPGDSGTVKLDGRGTVSAAITGNTSAWSLEGDAAVDGVRVLANFGRTLKVHARIDQTTTGMQVAVQGSADTVRLGNLGYRPVSFAMTGRLDSMSVSASVGFLKKAALRTRFETWTDSSHRDVRVDSLFLELPVHRWTIQAPFRVHLRPGTMELDSVDFRSEGAGFLIMAGTLSKSLPSDFLVDADSVPLEDIYALLQRDTTGVKGAFSADAKISGPAASPVMELSAELAEGQMGDYSLPLIQVQGAYRERHLTITGALSRDSVRIVTIHGSVPLDLSLHSVPQRQLDGPVNIVAQADTLDMRVLNAITGNITGVSGTMALNVTAGGTWTVPIFSGFVDITNGALQVPAIGASYSGINFRLEGSGDNSFHVARGEIRSGSGTLGIAGSIRFTPPADTSEGRGLTHPKLDLQLSPNRFAAFNIRGFGAITATGSLTLTGPVLGATLAGSITADEGTLQFANLVQKRIVSLDDPEFRAMVDSNLAGADLAPAGHQIFFDSLRIRGLTLTMGPDVWLRSSEANIQIAGGILVDRTFSDNLARYRIDGTLRALRGNYRLAIGLENSFLAVTRDFRVTRGTVRFFGTPDLNPDMDVAAEYVTRTVQRQPLTVRAIIEGTLLYPRLRLETDSPLPLTETEIASYLMFGTPSPDFGGSGLGSQAAVVAGGALGGVGQALANQLGLPINYITITPGTGNPSSSTGIAASRIEAGVQIGEKTFLTLTAGLCEVKAGRGVGAALERRLSDVWSLNAAFEPVVQECGVAAGLVQLKYQFGLDLFWQQGIR